MTSTTQSAAAMAMSSAMSSCAPARWPATARAGSSVWRRGVAAWTRAWPQQPAPVRQCRPPAAVPAAAGGELVGALATMALARLAA
jgi:hypothetical protein